MNSSESLKFKLWKNNRYVTAKDIAEHYGLSREHIKSIVKKNKAELKQKGLRVKTKVSSEMREALELSSSVNKCTLFTEEALELFSNTSTMMMKLKSYSKSQLKKRGWTEASIKLFLKEPDSIKVDKCSHPLQLYNKERVHKIEQSKEFQDWKGKKKRSKKSLKERKSQHILDWVDSIQIDIPKMNRDKLIKKACLHHNWNKENQREDYTPVTPEIDDIAFLKRITLNYIRHQLTPYEEKLEKLFGNAGKELAYYRLKERIKEEAFKVYPWLE